MLVDEIDAATNRAVRVVAVGNVVLLLVEHPAFNRVLSTTGEERLRRERLRDELDRLRESARAWSATEAWSPPPAPVALCALPPVDHPPPQAALPAHFPRTRAVARDRRPLRSRVERKDARMRATA